MSKFDSIQTGRPVGSHLTCSKGRLRYDGVDIQPGTRFAVILPTWEDGYVRWKDHKIADTRKMSPSTDLCRSSRMAITNTLR
jgi:hypothetical protein